MYHEVTKSVMNLQGLPTWTNYHKHVYDIESMHVKKIYLDRAQVLVLKWKLLRNYVSKVDYWEWKLSSR